MALRATMPSVARVAPLNVPQVQARPAIGLALGGAIALLGVLIGGQVLFPPPTYRVETIALDQPINMTGAPQIDTASSTDLSPAAQTHVAMRIPTESATDQDPATATTNGDRDPTVDKADAAPTDGKTSNAQASAHESTKPAPAVTAPKRKRLVTFLGGKLTLDTYQHPILGDPEAPHVIVEMVSYDCPHCRKMHRIVQRGLKRYGDQLAVLILVVPLEMKCNKLVKDPKASHQGACTTARMALAVAHIKPAAFRAFHEWLMADEEKPPSHVKAVEKAYSMVDSAKLRELTSGDTLNKQIAQYVDLFDTLQKQRATTDKNFGLPVQILGDEVMTGSAVGAEDVYQAWEKDLGVQPL
jgi:protein-disulfide isomerase